MRVMIKRNNWNDTDTIKLIGQIGRITDYNKDNEFVDVLFNHKDEPITFNINELELDLKNKQ